MRNVSVSRNESRHQRAEWTAGWDGKGEVAFPPEPPTTLHVRAIKQMQIAKVAGKNAHLSQPPKKQTPNPPMQALARSPLAAAETVFQWASNSGAPELITLPSEFSSHHSHSTRGLF
jgi:hypothetical protein